MIAILFSVFLAWILHFFGFNDLVGLTNTSYYLAFAVFGAIIHLIQIFKR